MSDIAVRSLRDSEWDLLRDLRLRALLDSPESFGSTYEREATMRKKTNWLFWISGESGVSTSQTFVAEQSKELVGMATGVDFETQPGLVNLFGMWVHPAMRSMGVGRRLTDAVVEWASARDAERVLLRVTETNAAAIHLYTSAGFRLMLDDREPLRHGSDFTTLGMEMVLVTRYPRRDSPP